MALAVDRGLIERIARDSSHRANQQTRAWLIHRYLIAATKDNIIRKRIEGETVGRRTGYKLGGRDGGARKTEDPEVSGG